MEHFCWLYYFLVELLTVICFTLTSSMFHLIVAVQMVSLMGSLVCSGKEDCVMFSYHLHEWEPKTSLLKLLWPHPHATLWNIFAGFTISLWSSWQSFASLWRPACFIWSSLSKWSAWWEALFAAGKRIAWYIYIYAIYIYIYIICYPCIFQNVSWIHES